MTKRTLNLNELEWIAGGTDIAENAAATSKPGSIVKDPPATSGNGGGGSVDTVDVQQNQDLPGA